MDIHDIPEEIVHNFALKWLQERDRAIRLLDEIFKKAGNTNSFWQDDLFGIRINKLLTDVNNHRDSSEPYDE